MGSYLCKGFLGTLGTIRIFIKNFATHAKPLVQLTRKGVDFEFSEDHVLAMEKLKMFVQNCTAIKAIEYSSDREVTLAVDSSWMAVGFILSQKGEDGNKMCTLCDGIDDNYDGIMSCRLWQLDDEVHADSVPWSRWNGKRVEFSDQRMSE